MTANLDHPRPAASAPTAARPSLPMLTREEELRLARLARAGDQAAFDRMVRAHLPLVHAMARQYRSHGCALDDLVGEAMLGLVKGARNFDPERGASLAAYAALWIRANLQRFTLENRRIVRGPNTRNARRLFGNLRRAERDIERRDGRRADAEAVAEALAVTTAEVEEVRSVLSARDVPTSETPEQYRELRCDEASPEAAAADAESRKLASELVSSALAQLEPRMRDILVRRCLHEAPPTLAELGREASLSRERVRQIEVQARGKLRSAIAAVLATRNLPPDVLWAA